jgi:hypothetical protein
MVKNSPVVGHFPFRARLIVHLLPLQLRDIQPDSWSPERCNHPQNVRSISSVASQRSGWHHSCSRAGCGRGVQKETAVEMVRAGGNSFLWFALPCRSIPCRTSLTTPLVRCTLGGPVGFLATRVWTDSLTRRVNMTPHARSSHRTGSRGTQVELTSAEVCTDHTGRIRKSSFQQQTDNVSRTPERFVISSIGVSRAWLVLLSPPGEARCNVCFVTRESV